MLAQESDFGSAQSTMTYALVSIIISNYNYARFLREAIDSALNQTYPHIEIIVVDDGSTDDSQEIMATYGNRIVPVYKENGGQSSAINAGFAVSKGELVCLMDSDDLFFPEKVSLVLRAWQATPSSTLVYHQLEPVDAHKTKLGRPWPRGVWCGDIRPRVQRSGGWWPHPTTSALSFPRTYLQRLLPVPQPNRSIYPDSYLAGPAAFIGPVVGLRLPLASSRLHGQNHSNWSRRTVADDARSTRQKLRRSLDQYVDEFHQLEESLSRCLGVSTNLSLDHHVPYQRYRWAIGERISRLHVAFTALRCPALPPSMRLTEVAKILLNRW